MLFCSHAFLAFFAVVFSLYWLLPRPRVRIWLLLGASYYFYSGWNHWLALLITATSILDYLGGRALDTMRSPRGRLAVLLGSIGVNLGLLVYFKYANFFLRSLEDLLAGIGASASFPVLRVLLPVGISFYTFEAINYVVDVYRRKCPAEKRLEHFLLFILFFPHLIAGPIVRARDFLPQVRRRKHFSWLRMQAGLRLFLLGMVKKLAVADRMPQYVDPVFADPQAFATGVLWLATVAYAVQLYCDFSGYSDMALGLAHCFGFHLTVNFRLPYLSANISEFWRRWHISLGTWIRDYIFIPLGGSRGGRLRTALNLLIVMTLCGLWHGAAWNYVLFGFTCGCLLVAHRAFHAICEQLPGLSASLSSAPGTVVRIAFTFWVFCTSLVIFRCPTPEGAAAMFGRMFTLRDGYGFPMHPHGLALTLVAFFIAQIASGLWPGWVTAFNRLPPLVRASGLATAWTVALVLVPDVSRAFIYFQF